MIGQGTIDRLLLQTPAERKSFFDEAVGIKEFQIKRHHAALKLNRTHENMTQADALLQEIEPRLRSLRRQVKKLEQRQTVEIQLRELQEQYYVTQHTDLSTQIETLQSEYDVINTDYSEVEQKLTAIQQELANLAQEKSRQEQFNELQQELSTLQQKKNNLERERAIVAGKLQTEFSKAGKQNVGWLEGKISEYTESEKTANGERAYDIYSRLLKDRIIFIGTAIDDHVANIIIAQMLFLANQDPDQDIKLYINSPGGSVTAGLAIYDTMQHIKPDVSTICVGMAASMASVLLAAGAQGKRFILPNGEVMIHQVMGGTQGQASDIKIHAERILKIKDRLNTILQKHTGKEMDVIEKDSDRDYFMSSEESVKYGIVDKVIE